MITNPSLGECWTRLPERVILVSVPVEFRLKQLRRRHLNLSAAATFPVCALTQSCWISQSQGGGRRSLRRHGVRTQASRDCFQNYQNRPKREVRKEPLSANSRSGVCGGSENNDKKQASSGLRLDDRPQKPLVITHRCAIESRTRHTAERQPHRQTHGPSYGSEIKKGQCLTGA